MEPAEEQAAELEALDAIFQEDFKVTNEASVAHGARFEISLLPDGAPDVRLRLTFEHSLAYPDEPLAATAHVLSGLTAPRRKAIQTVVDATAEGNIGAPSAFTIIEAVREWVEADARQGMEVEEEEDDEVDAAQFETRDASTAAKVEVIASKAIGTPVSVESFAEWRNKFEAEIQEMKSASEKTIENNSKATGRQLFEQNKAVVSGDSESFWESIAERADDVGPAETS
jgi:RWD domain/DRG Family Regulatory Proteins, Tma46